MLHFLGIRKLNIEWLEQSHSQHSCEFKQTKFSKETLVVLVRFFFLINLFTFKILQINYTLYRMKIYL